MKFLCYETYSRDSSNKDPVCYCILGEGKIWIGPTLEYAKSQATLENAMCEFIEDCGWILEGEEQALLDIDNQELIAFTLKLRHPELTSL